MKIKFALIVVSGLLVCCTQETPGKVAAKDPATAGGPTSQPTKSKPPKVAATTEVAVADRIDVDAYDHFGDGVAKGPEAVTLAAIAEDPKKLAGQKIRLTGKVQSVCKKKGCWMILSEGSTEVRIKFRDYGFFMPLDCEGREAILDGGFSVTEVSVAEIKHLLEDAGKPEEAKKVDKPRFELTVMADGVALKK